MRTSVWREGTAVACDALRSNPTRTVLTVLSVVIGVASIVFCVSAGRSLGDFIERQLSTLGTDLMWIRPVSDGTRSAIRTEPLTHEDAEAVGRLAGVREVGPRAGRTVVIGSQRRHIEGEVLAVGPGYFQMRNKELARGRSLVPADLALRRRVCVIGPGVLEGVLYWAAEPLGESIKLDGKPFTVVGVLAGSGLTVKTPGLEEDDAVFIPLTTGARVFGLRELEFLFFQPDPSVPRGEVVQRIYQLLLRRKGTRSAYEVDSLEARMQQVTNLIWVAVVVFGGIAAVSLIVAGVGIMNIMLLSVIERTREIGIRKSVGASKRHILIQFFTEALVLSGAGGCLGVLAGCAGVSALSWVTSGVVSISWLGIAVGFSVAMATGVCSGLYPASQAANLEPITALAREVA